MKKLFFLFLFIGVLGYGQSNKNIDLRNPKSTIYTHLYFLMPDSYDVNKAASTIKDIPRSEAREKVIKIKEILDGNGLRVDFSKIPDNPKYIDTTGIGESTIDISKNRYAPFPLRMPHIYVEKYGNHWYYSKETLDKVDELHKKTFPLEFSLLNNNFPEFFQIKVFNMYIWKPIMTLVVIGLCFLIYYLAMPIVFRLLKFVSSIGAKHKMTDNSLQILKELARPLVFLIIIRFIRRVLPSLQLLEWNAYLMTGVRIAGAVFWIVVVLKLQKIALNMYQERAIKRQSKLDRQLTPILGKLLSGIIILIGFLHILTLFGVDPTAVLAGASIGGVAIALAAQDSVKNFIGTMVIFMDSPFQLDDWVEIGGIEGSVVKVGIRSTQLRAADTTLYQIPNSKVAEIEINNKGLRIYRRYTANIGIRYDTPPDLIEAFMEGIKEVIQLHPETRSQSYNVEFTSFEDFSLNIMVNVYFKSPDWGMEQASKNLLHLAILRLAAKLGVEFAFPSSTLMVETLPGQESLAAQYKMSKEDMNKSIKELMDEFKMKDHRYDPDTSKIPGL